MTPFYLLVGWASADYVLQRLAPLWAGARGLEFTRDYILQGIDASANLVHLFLIVSNVLLYKCSFRQYP